MAHLGSQVWQAAVEQMHDTSLSTFVLMTTTLIIGATFIVKKISTDKVLGMWYHVNFKLVMFNPPCNLLLRLEVEGGEWHQTITMHPILYPRPQALATGSQEPFREHYWGRGEVLGFSISFLRNLAIPPIEPLFLHLKLILFFMFHVYSC